MDFRNHDVSVQVHKRGVRAQLPMFRGRQFSTIHIFLLLWWQNKADVNFSTVVDFAIVISG